MKYILLKDLEGDLEELDDAVYAIRTRSTGQEQEDAQPTRELLSEADIFRIRKNAPEGADAIAFTDDWVYWNSVSKDVISYVFRD
jgi:hypothetical protein